MHRRTAYRLLTTVVAGLLALHPASAQMVDGKQIVRAELIHGGEQPDGSFLLGIKFTIEPGWYLYWKNPGDAGLPIAVNWDLPAGYAVGELLYPTPTKMADHDIVAYGYKNELVLIAKLSPSSDRRTAGTVKAALDWLVCKESCLRGKATVELSLAAPPTGKEILRRYQQLLPRALAESGLTVSSARSIPREGKRDIVVEFAGSRAPRIADFFPETIEDAAIDFRSIKAQNGRVTLSIEPYRKETKIRELKGLLLIDGAAYECVIPLQSL
jgi:DsbC/DsbD-like thiol-disulfide interchange protein